MSLATGARAIMAWALRGTKQLSPVRAMPATKSGKKAFGVIKTKGKPGKIQSATEYRPWAKFALGERTGLGWMGIGAEGRKTAAYGYKKFYKHTRTHKKLYGAGVAGAAIWDFLPGKDNP